MKIVLAGSPQISVKTFQKVIDNFDVVAIVTQPDKPRGRGMKTSPTPVSELGLKNNIKVIKPGKIIEAYEELKSLDFDLFLTFAYGQFIPEKILKLGKFKPLNIHGSLLPKYRGAAPIHYAVLNGDKEVGITLMEMVKEMDAGDMYFKASQAIDPESTTTGEAFEIIASLAEKHIVSWLKKYFNKEVKGEAQGKDFSLSPKITKEKTLIDNHLTVAEAKRKILGLNPFPGAYTMVKGKRVKLYNFGEEKPGSIKLLLKDGTLFIKEFKIEGKRLQRL